VPSNDPARRPTDIGDSIDRVGSGHDVAKARAAVEGLLAIGKALAARGVRVTQNDIRAMRDEGPPGPFCHREGIMGTIRIRLPVEIHEIIERQVAAGRVESADAYLVEAARRFAEDLEVEDEIVVEAKAGIANAEA
jgi:Arc/MetJ-type ribon-helix-helix transcriptional regulator